MENKTDFIIVPEERNKSLWWKVQNPQSGTVHQVSITTRCDCRYMALEGVPNGNYCHHVRAVLAEMVGLPNPKRRKK